MPRRDRYRQLKRRDQEDQQINDIFASTPDYFRGISPELLKEQDEAWTNLAQYLAEDEIRRLASYSSDGNAVLKSNAAIRLAIFAAKCAEHIASPVSAMHAARIIRKRGLDEREVAAIAVDIRRVRTQQKK